MNHLVKTLALLQSYGIHNYLISDGVGGGYCGVAIDHTGVHWQQDILYLVANEKLTTAGMAGSFARDNLWCLYSSLGEAGTVVFGHESCDLSTQQQHQRISNFTAEMEAKHDNGRFDYIIVLSLKPHSITVIETHNNLYHSLIRIDPRPDKKKTLGIIWSRDLLEMVGRIELPEGNEADSDYISIRHIPYLPRGGTTSRSPRKVSG